MAYNVQSRYDLQGTRLQEINDDPAGTATYKSGTETLTGLKVSLGRTETQELMPGVAVTQVRYQDFIIDAADLDFGAGPVKPKYGDTITRGNGEAYKVVAIGDTPFEYITASKKRMRIHTERI